MKYREAYENGIKRLSDAGVLDANLDARLLLEYVCHTDRSYLYAHGDDEVNDIQLQMYDMLIEKRADRIPLQHITGSQEFMGLNFFVNENVLIPRQDTEILVEEALTCIEDGSLVLDMCTGSGCVLISIAKYKNYIKATGVDISEKALEIARKNADNLLSDHNCEEVVFINSDLFDNIDGQFDIITANPPYIQTAVVDTLEPEVREYDPALALDGGEDGLGLIRRIVSDAPAFLKSGGYLMMEIGYDQGDICRELFTEGGFADVRVIKDLANNDRVVVGRK